MCTVSMIMDHYRDRWAPLVPPTEPQITIWPPAPPEAQKTPEEMQRALAGLRSKEPVITDAEISEFRALLKRAREYDKRMNQPDCEMDEKRAALKAIAAALGIDVSFIDLPEAAGRGRSPCRG
jgi:hypothetical protein